MRSQAWKAQERQVAEVFGSHRNPNTGEHRLDIEAGPWGIEHKARKRLPSWLKGALKQAETGCGDSQTPLVVLSEVSQGKKAERYVLMKLSDWIDWFGGNDRPQREPGP